LLGRRETVRHYDSEPSSLIAGEETKPRAEFISRKDNEAGRRRWGGNNLETGGRGDLYHVRGGRIVSGRNEREKKSLFLGGVNI